MTQWDNFCANALNKAKQKMESETKEDRYETINNKLDEMSRFIAEYGWDAWISHKSEPNTGNGWHQYSDPQIAKHVYDILETPYHSQFKQYTQSNETNKINTLTETCIAVIIDKVYDSEMIITDESLPIHPVCFCGEVLVPVYNNQCYPNTYVICDICNKIVTDIREVFHCPKGRIALHNQGYDVCIECARKYHDNFKRYIAFIIQTLDSGGNLQCGDANNLVQLFYSLGYHHVYVLKNNLILNNDHQYVQNPNDMMPTKQNIENKLKELALTNKTNLLSKQNANTDKENDVVVVVYSGHGDSTKDPFEFWLTTPNPSNPEEPHYTESLKSTEFIKTLIKMNNVSFGIESMIHHSTYDVVMFINACNSGTFDPNVIKDGNDKNNKKNLNKMSAESQIPVNKLKIDCKEFDTASRTIVTITSNLKNEDESNYGGGCSPFINYLVDSFKDSVKNINGFNRNKSNVPWPGSPQYIFNHIKTKNDVDIKDKKLDHKQNANNVKNGHQNFINQLSLIPVHNHYSQPLLTIYAAIYGLKDVTNIVQYKVGNNSTSFKMEASDKIFGDGNWSDNNNKSLIIVWGDGFINNIQTTIVKEGNTLSISINDMKPADYIPTHLFGEINILSAVYGLKPFPLFVSQHINKKGKELKLKASNNIFRCDPWNGVRKSFVVVYTVSALNPKEMEDSIKIKMVKENETMEIEIK